MDVELRGLGFVHIPQDAIGVYSANNESPLETRYSTNARNLGNVSIVDNNTMSVIMKAPHEYGTSHYLGGIVSKDRETVYWVNETAPLPD